MSRETLRKWGIGLFGAAINSAASGGVVMLTDPLAFNPFDWAGLKKLAAVTVGAAIVGAFLYLKQHPLPLD